MGAIKLTCPKCGRILGDTNESIDAILNCNGCKEHVRIRMRVVRFKDYFEDSNIKQEQIHDKSK